MGYWFHSVYIDEKEYPTLASQKAKELAILAEIRPAQAYQTLRELYRQERWEQHEKRARGWSYWYDRFEKLRKEAKGRSWPVGDFVYFVYSPSLDLIKIGYTGSLQSRFQKLESELAKDIVILGAIPGGRAEEATVHKIFAPFRVRNELFAKVEPILFFVKHFATVKGAKLAELYPARQARFEHGPSGA